jgi:hypothetical protein
MTRFVLTVATAISCAAAAQPCDPIDVITPPDGERFGSNVAFDGRHAVVQGEAGALYAAEISAGDAWRIPLVPSPYSNQLAIDDRAVVIHDGQALRSFDITTGVVLQTFVPSHDDEDFAQRFATHSGALAVAAEGAVYLFDLQTGATLWRVDDGDVCPSGCHFGNSVAVNADTVAIGAPTWNNLPDDYGTVFLVDRATGRIRGRTHATSPSPPPYLGEEVALGDSMVMSSSSQILGVLMFDAATGEQTGYWEDERVDWYVSPNFIAAGDFAIIPRRTTSATVLDKHGRYVGRLPTPSFHVSYNYPDGFAGAHGIVVAGDTSTITEPNGAAFVIDLNGFLPCGATDLAPPFGRRTFADVSAFLDAFTQERPTADLASKCGRWTIADVAAFLDNWVADCPGTTD